MDDIGANVAAVRARIGAACRVAHRPETDVRLLAVTKTFGVEAIRRAQAAGLTEFGENYLQEAMAKISQLPRAGLTWHFIGPIQSNKTRGIAETFDWVQGIDRAKIAQRLSEQRPANLPPLQVCVQVNISGEASKSGCAPEETESLCRAIAALPRLQLRGLMAIPAPQEGDVEYRRLRELFDALRRAGHALDTLSAGMSDDLELAIGAGSTLVRIGTALFGPRERAVQRTE
jgi:pyridoxal phosphate enzyme (YggS family)